MKHPFAFEPGVSPSCPCRDVSRAQVCHDALLLFLRTRGCLVGDAEGLSSGSAKQEAAVQAAMNVA